MTRVAAVDCGTNSLRLLVAETADGPVELDRRMEIVRLGEGVDRTGRLSRDALGRARTVLAGYAGRIAELGAQRVRAVATSATRDAGNAHEFRELVHGTLGVLPEVISGEEEARLSFVGAVAGLDADLPGPYLVVDIGGGSTEFVVGDRRPAAEIAGAVSVPLGSVRMTERHLPGDPPTASEVAALTADVTAAVGAALAAVPAAGARTLVGLAGSVTTLAALALDLRSYRSDLVHGARLTYRQVDAVTAGLLAATRAERAGSPVMHPGRADVIGSGAVILRTIMERAGFDQVVVSEHDILDGIVWSLIDRPVATSVCPPRQSTLG